jgi:hypothetical protein
MDVLRRAVQLARLIVAESVLTLAVECARTVLVLIVVMVVVKRLVLVAVGQAVVEVAVAVALHVMVA